ncbi:MAG: PAC2 family protein, partial [Chloroflexota bacterium]|nr:PAC2 family protein [Chloroflexota bacterium]
PVPEMKDTIAVSMLRPWIDVGRVGTLSLRALQRYLGAKEIGRLHRPGKFFDFTRYRPRMRLVNGNRIFTKPNTIVHYAHDEYTDRDYLFLHVREPHNFGEDYTESIVELLKFCNVTEYCRIGGMYDSVPHTRPILVTGSMKDDQEQKAAGKLNPRRSTYQGPTSIVNQVNEDLTGLGIANTTLMAHLPQYVQLDEDHLGAARLLEVLSSVYGFPSELADMAQGEQQYKEIDKAIDYGGEVGTLIKQLETYYDRVLSRSEDKSEPTSSDSSPSSSSNPNDGEDINLSPDVEDFLNQMGERFENNAGGGGAPPEDVADESDDSDEPEGEEK